MLDKANYSTQKAELKEKKHEIAEKRHGMQNMCRFSLIL